MFKYPQNTFKKFDPPGFNIIQEWLNRTFIKQRWLFMGLNGKEDWNEGGKQQYFIGHQTSVDMTKSWYLFSTSEKKLCFFPKIQLIFSAELLINNWNGCN